MPEIRPCAVCETEFTARSRVDKTCSVPCQFEWRRHLNREKARRYYKPRPPRPDIECEACKAAVPQARSGPGRRWCAACRKNADDIRGRKRAAARPVRRCYKCSVEMPGVSHPGVAVCDSCRVDPRPNLQEKERARRLRKYGLTQQQYDQMLTDQGALCAVCGTDDPGVKGWCIDHCHATGEGPGPAVHALQHGDRPVRR